jgi:phosphodiesterase/alkaline phosphatase D-like protein
MMVGGQFLNPVAVYENYSNVAPGERDRIIRLLRQEAIEGVIFLTGNRRMNITCYGTTGNLLWEYTIHENDVK